MVPYISDEPGGGSVLMRTLIILVRASTGVNDQVPDAALMVSSTQDLSWPDAFSLTGTTASF